MSSTGRAGLTTQPLPRVSGDTVGFTPIRFRHLESRFQPSAPPVFIIFLLSLHRAVDTTMGHISSDISISGVYRRTEEPPSSGSMARLADPCCNHTGANIWPRQPQFGFPLPDQPLATHWQDMGKLIPLSALSYAAMKYFRAFTKYLKVFTGYPAQQDPICIWLQSSNYINYGWVDLHRSKAATSPALDWS